MMNLLRSNHIILARRDRSKLLAIIISQVTLSVLDLFGVIILGLVGTISFNGIQGGQSSGLTQSLIGILRLSEFSFQIQVSILSALAVIVLISKTLLSVYFTRKTFLFFAKRSAILSGEVLDYMLNQDLQNMNRISSSNNLHMLTVGTNALMLGVLATGLTIISDVTLLMVLMVGLFVVSPISTILTVGMFGIMGIVLHKLLSERAEEMGSLDSKLQIKSNNQIRELFSSFRETLVQNSQPQMVRQIVGCRSELADTQAEMALMPNLSKYIIESSVLLFAFLLAGIQFLTQDALQAISSLAIFLAAGSRMAPALLRIQQGTLKIRNNIGHSDAILNVVLDDSFIKSSESRSTQLLPATETKFIPRVNFNDVEVTYFGSTSPSLRDINLQINPGEFLALTGPSGAGKSTLVDVMLGVIHPTRGNVKIAGVSPRESFSIWPGCVAYVPQETFITDGTVKDNIILGSSDVFIDDDRIWKVLELVQLKDFVSGLPSNLNTLVGENGAMISGGQRQRLGIARALFSNPQLLIMDEATSALDAETESEISRAITQLKGKLTLIVVSHRYSTIANADRIIYIEDGVVKDEGNFDTLIVNNSNFRKQAKLMGFQMGGH